MVEGETILQGEVFTRFILPFFLVFFVIFALLEKTKLFGDGKKQINAMISFVVGLIGRTKFKHWVLRIVINVCLNFVYNA